MQMMFGDRDLSGGISTGETPPTTGAYILWSAGPDEKFGVDMTIIPLQRDLNTIAADVPNSDDVTNFKQ
jgi:hypothetical protein